MKIPITLLTPADAPALSALHAACFDRGWSADEFANLLAQPAMRGWATGNKGFILCCRAGGESEIMTLAVAAADRRKGIAAALLAHALQACAQEGNNRMFLEVDERNQAAQQLYQTQGFSMFHRRKGYYRHADGSFSDALLLQRTIGK
jgi:ribosomal-protein-alanine N-acetyltransferase